MQDMSELINKTAPVPMTERLRGCLEILAAFALAGSSVPLGKKLTGELPLFLTAFLSLGTALLVLGPVLWLRRRELKQLGRRSLGLIVLQALSGMVLFRILLFAGLRLTGALDAAIITSLTPLVVGLAGVLFLGERLCPRLAAALFLAVAGVLLLKLGPHVLAPSGTGLSAGSLAGGGLVFLAVCGEAAMTVLRKKDPSGIDSLLNTGLIVATAFLCMLPLAVAETLHLGGVPRLTPLQIGGLAYYGAGATALAYILWGSGCRRIPASLAALFMAAMPLTAALLAVLVLGEKPTAGFWLGGGLVLAALAAGSLKGRSTGELNH